MKQTKNAAGLTPSEQFVVKLCQNSFLKLWTHPNPIGKKGKELCDCLIVCGAHVIIISVKEIEYKDTGDKIGYERWTKAAINKSAAQIYGAERWLENKDIFIRNDNRSVELPPKESRIIHRVSVSLGGKGKIPITWGELGNGFVHVFDEVSIDVVFRLLDTITDFTEFLSETKKLTSTSSALILEGGGLEDLACIFLKNGYEYPWNASEKQIVVVQDIWSQYSKEDELLDYLEAMKESYRWDKLIEVFANDLLTDGMFEFPSKNITESQHALIEMALQPRSIRAQLSKALFEIIASDTAEKVAARCAKAYNGVAFVFMPRSSEDREARVQELALRCYVIRAKVLGVTKVVGIATDKIGSSKIGYSSDIVYIDLPEISEDFLSNASSIQLELGYFENL